MANQLLNTALILPKIHAHAWAASSFIPSVRNDYEKKFAVPGNKVGSTIGIKRMNLFNVVDTFEISPSPINEQEDLLTLNMQTSVSVNHADADLVLAIDDRNDTEVIDMANRLAERMEKKHIINAMIGIPTTVGIAGTFPTSQAQFGTARAALNMFESEKIGRSLFVTSNTASSIIAGQSTLFNPSTEISKEFHDGMLGPIAAFKRPFENDMLSAAAISTGTRTGDTTHAAGSSGLTGAYNVTAYTATTLTISGATGYTVLSGETLQINGVSCVVNGTVMPMVFQAVVGGGSYVTTNNVSTWTPTTYTDAAGVVTLPIANPGMVASGVAQTMTISPVGQTATFFGAASSSFTWNLAIQKKAYSFASVKLTQPVGNAMEYGEKTVNGISFSIWLGGNITNRTFPFRLDNLSGGVLHPIASQAFIPACRINCGSGF